MAAFLSKDARARARELLWSARRSKWTGRLPHWVEFDTGTALAIEASSHTAESIERLLRKAGAKDHCWLVSENSDLDGNSLPLREALDRVVGQGFATVISCLPGRLGYYEGEGPRNRLILRAK